MVGFAGAVGATFVLAATAPAILGLDHVPIAVESLEGASEHYRRMGFTLKPGRPHDNGIRNEHAKFPDGTELELITAPQARDALTVSLISVWLAGEDLSWERRLLKVLGATLEGAQVDVPDSHPAEVARLPEGDVVLLPGSHLLLPGRRIVGATVRVRSLEAVERLLATGPWAPARRVSRARGSSVFLPPTVTHGLWLEFREAP